MIPFDSDKARTLFNSLQGFYDSPRERANNSAKVFTEIKKHYEEQILALEAKVQVLEQDVIYAELLKLRNLSERILTAVQPPPEGTDQSQGDEK